MLRCYFIFSYMRVLFIGIIPTLFQKMWNVQCFKLGIFFNSGDERDKKILYIKSKWLWCFLCRCDCSPPAPRRRPTRRAWHDRADGSLLIELAILLIPVISYRASYCEMLFFLKKNCSNDRIKEICWYLSTLKKLIIAYFFTPSAR